MKKLNYISLITILIFAIHTASFANWKQQSIVERNEIAELYKHLANHINYPKRALQANVQGNNIILFKVIEGKLKDLKVETELGTGFDTEVLNNILTFTNFKAIKNGKYALTTTFKLDGSQSTLINEKVEAVQGYTQLKLTITAISPELINKNEKFQTLQSNQNLKATSVALPNQIKINEPLIILDGKTIKGTVDSISPETIESITILKGISAIDKYGEEGKNGVLIITSKTKSNQTEIRSPIKIDKTDTGINKNKEPFEINAALIVLDNQVIENGLGSIAPDTIQSINVLKGFSATSLYGDAGKNGVLIITTKKKADKKLPLQKSNH